MTDPLAIIDDRIRDLEERLDELRALRDQLAGTEPGKVLAPVTGAEEETEEDDEESAEFTEIKAYRNLRLEWAANVPDTDAERVAQVRAALQSGSLWYVNILKRLPPGWRTVDLSKVLKGHPEEFRQTVNDAGQRVWELGAVADAKAPVEMAPPEHLDSRCKVIARVLKAGPMMHQAIQAQLRWPPNFVASALTRQQKMARPWFRNTDRGWELTEWAWQRLAS